MNDDSRNLRIQQILERLGEAYPDETALNYENPFQLLVATILSAQSTDRQVNKITSRLFKQYQTPDDFLELSPKEMAETIRGVGLYRTKSRYILESCRKLVEEYGGEVPTDRQELMKLPGVGRKTANVVLSCAFGQDTMAVDTHVHRVANRLGLVKTTAPEKTEEELTASIPQNYWSRLHHWLIFHGRRVCRARSPRCGQCELADLCPEAEKQEAN